MLWMHLMMSRPKVLKNISFALFKFFRNFNVHASTASTSGFGLQPSGESGCNGGPRAAQRGSVTNNPVSSPPPGMYVRATYIEREGP